MKYLICENCHEVVASFDTIEYPVVGEMFESKFAPDREMRPPWMPGTESAWLKCPVCRKRVFHSSDPKRLRVSDSREGLDPHWFEIVQPGANDEAETEACPKCGRKITEFKTKTGFMGHVRYCKGAAK
jgi:hypothetical protein